MSTNTVSIYMTVFAADCCLAKLIEGPKSTCALLQEVSAFNCSGIGVVIWHVNGLQVGHVSLSENKLSRPQSTTTSSGSTLSRLSVPAIPENNNISISCLVVDNPLVETSAVAVLTVLGKMHSLLSLNYFLQNLYPINFLVGIGAVKNVMLVEDNSTQLTLTWEEPFHSQDVSSLYYSVSIINMDTMKEMNQNSTNTSYQLHFVNCGNYQITVTPYGNCGLKTCNYLAMEVTVDHNLTYAGGETLFCMWYIKTF